MAHSNMPTSITDLSTIPAKDMPVIVQRDIISNDGEWIEHYDSRTRKLIRTDEGQPFYLNPMLTREIAGIEDGTVEVLSVKVPSKPDAPEEIKYHPRHGTPTYLFRWIKEMEKLQNLLRLVKPTIVWPNNDDSVAIICIKEGGVPREWNTFRNFSVALALNTPKRLGMTNTHAHMFHTFESVNVVHGPTYGPYQHVPFDDMEPTVLIVPALEGHEFAVDGELYMSKEAFTFLLEGMDKRIRAYDEDKADQVVAKYRKTRVLTIRGLLMEGLAKGHVIVCDDLPAPFMLRTPNLKPNEITSKLKDFMVHFTHEKPMGAVHSDRVLVAKFYYSLFNVDTPNREGSQGLLKDAFLDQIAEWEEQFLSGQPMGFIRGMASDRNDPISSKEQKLIDWVDAGLDLRDSPYLQSVQLGGLERMWDIPEAKDEKKRTRMPVPFAESAKMKSWTTFRMAYPHSTRKEPEFGEYFMHPKLGRIVSDDTFEVQAPIQGGADKDDGDYNNYRKLTDCYLVHGMLFEPGEVVNVGIRNPIGSTCVNKVIGTEFIMLRPTSKELERITKKFGELPTLDPNMLPVNVSELDLSSITEFPEVSDNILDEYDSYNQFLVMDTIQGRKLDLGDNKMTWEGGMSEFQGIYGQHTITRMQLHMYYIVADLLEKGLIESPILEEYGLDKEEFAFESGGREEDFIDACTKDRDIHRLRYIQACNAADKAVRDHVLVDMAINSPETLEELGRFNPILELVRFHKLHTNAMLTRMRQHLVDMVAESKVVWDGFEPTHLWEYQGSLVAPARVWVSDMEKHYREVLGVDPMERLGHQDFEAIGNMVFSDLATKIADPKLINHTRENVFRALREAFYYTHVTIEYVEEVRGAPSKASNMFTRNESYLMGGQLFQMLVAALVDEKLESEAAGMVEGLIIQ